MDVNNQKCVKRIYFTNNTKSMLYSLMLTTIISVVGKILVNVSKDNTIWEAVQETVDISFYHYIFECVALNLIIWAVGGIVVLFAENTKKKMFFSQIFLGVFLIYIIIYLIGFFITADITWLIVYSVFTMAMGVLNVCFFAEKDEMADDTYASDGNITG